MTQRRYCFGTGFTAYGTCIGLYTCFRTGRISGYFAIVPHVTNRAKRGLISRGADHRRHGRRPSAKDIMIGIVSCLDCVCMSRHTVVSDRCRVDRCSVIVLPRDRVVDRRIRYLYSNVIVWHADRCRGITVSDRHSILHRIVSILIDSIADRRIARRRIERQDDLRLNRSAAQTHCRSAVSVNRLCCNRVILCNVDISAEVPPRKVAARTEVYRYRACMVGINRIIPIRRMFSMILIPNFIVCAGIPTVIIVRPNGSSFGMLDFHLLSSRQCDSA